MMNTLAYMVRWSVVNALLLGVADTYHANDIAVGFILAALIACEVQGIPR